MNFLLVFIGGGIGSLLRYLIGLEFQKTTLSLPWATFISNLSACLIFAFVVFLDNTREGLNSTVKLFIMIGFCGGLSTFSTFGYETFLLLKLKLYFFAFLNVFFTTTISLLLFLFLNHLKFKN